MRILLTNAIGFATVACVKADDNKGSAPQDKFANIRGVIDSRIEALKTSEATTHKELAAVSRELLTYVVDTADIGRVNRLLGVLGRMNRQLAVLYFQNFLPWKYEEEGQLFTTKLKGQTKVDNKIASITTWLSNEDNNIWIWQRDNVAPVERKVNFSQNIQNLLSRALDPENKDHIEVKDALNSIVAVIKLEDITSFVTDALKVKEEEEAKLKAAAEELAKQQQANENKEPETPKEEEGKPVEAKQRKQQQKKAA